ncbi:methyltransferase small domain protein [Gossypium australe]|uniref:Methyltransferase small domain protein n=1 Tax=Gossypium australe TaxID=47621 RepID=A0A5B6WYH3_9ROSI|nr:methyltransferase small domain protein [Gossypium australe]
MGQIISFIQKRLVGLVFYPFKRLRSRQSVERSEDLEDPKEQCTLLISTPELSDDPSCDSESDTDTIFRLHQNVGTTCIDIVGDNSRQDSGVCVVNVENLGGRQLVGAGEIRWIRHYCSSQRMLLVGEGDFSFSASLARAFGSAANMIATSLDSRGFLFRNYKKAIANIHELRVRGCIVLHGIDATEIANHCYLGAFKFDRIIFNFPHAGFCSDEPGESQKRRHQLLISLFLKNAREMIEERGEIHVTHKSNGFFRDWNLQGLAAAVGLRLIQEVPFNFTDYPGYRTKYGFGGDSNFNCNPSKTYKFGLCPIISHKILLVGEGNFSFAACLATSLGSGVNMVATSLDSKVMLNYKYNEAMANVSRLEELGCTVIHEVDCCTMSQHPKLKSNLFDRIVFNFPHAGFFLSSESTPYVIDLHKKVVKGFLSNAVEMLTENGEVHITHKTAHPFNMWEIEKLAKEVGLRLLDEVAFHYWDYPGYKNKRGEGQRCDESFPIGKSSTYKFKIMN